MHSSQQLSEEGKTGRFISIREISKCRISFISITTEKKEERKSISFPWISSIEERNEAKMKYLQFPFIVRFIRWIFFERRVIKGHYRIDYLILCTRLILNIDRCKCRNSTIIEFESSNGSFFHGDTVDAISTFLLYSINYSNQKRSIYL